MTLGHAAESHVNLGATSQDPAKAPLMFRPISCEANATQRINLCASRLVYMVMLLTVFRPPLSGGLDKPGCDIL